MSDNLQAAATLKYLTYFPVSLQILNVFHEYYKTVCVWVAWLIGAAIFSDSDHHWMLNLLPQRIIDVPSVWLLSSNSPFAAQRHQFICRIGMFLCKKRFDVAKPDAIISTEQIKSNIASHFIYLYKNKCHHYPWTTTNSLTWLLFPQEFIS